MRCNKSHMASHNTQSYKIFRFTHYFQCFFRHKCPEIIIIWGNTTASILLFRATGTTQELSVFISILSPKAMLLHMSLPKLDHSRVINNSLLEQFTGLMVLSVYWFLLMVPLVQMFSTGSLIHWFNGSLVHWFSDSDSLVKFSGFIDKAMAVVQQFSGSMVL